jgi:protein gp37
MAGPGGAYEGLVERNDSGESGDTAAHWTGKVRFVAAKLEEPKTWRKPRRVFVNSMSDVFHPGFSVEDILRVYQTMGDAAWHTYQVLTKRPARAREVLTRLGPILRTEGRSPLSYWRHVHLIVSAWDQASAEAMIPALLACPAAVRGVSLEPLLGPVKLDMAWLCADDETKRTEKKDREPRLSWVIVGAEGGPGARPTDDAWALSIVEQCRAARVPCFVKQLSGGRKDPAGWPEALRIRETPT